MSMIVSDCLYVISGLTFSVITQNCPLVHGALTTAVNRPELGFSQFFVGSLSTFLMHRPLTQ